MPVLRQAADVGCNGKMTLQKYISRLKWRQILVHLAAFLFFIYGIYTVAFLYDAKLVDIVGEEMLQDGGAWWGSLGVSISRLNNFTFIIGISTFLGMIVSFLISMKISISRNWFWFNSLLVLLLMIYFLFWANILNWALLRRVFWYPGHLISNTTFRFLINGTILITIGLLLFFSKQSNDFIEHKKLKPI